MMQNILDILTFDTAKVKKCILYLLHAIINKVQSS